MIHFSLEASHMSRFVQGRYSILLTFIFWIVTSLLVYHLFPIAYDFHELPYYTEGGFVQRKLESRHFFTPKKTQ